MILIDANLLLYAYDPRSAEHEASKRFLEASLAGSDLVRFAWITLWAFLRISTNARVFERPLTTTEAERVVSDCLAQPIAGVLDIRDYAKPGARVRMNYKADDVVVNDPKWDGSAIDLQFPASWVVTDGKNGKSKNRAVVVFVRGDHQLNETKLSSALGGMKTRPMTLITPTGRPFCVRET